MTSTIGQKLKEAREDQRLTLEKVFESTRIRVQYLQALEEDDMSLMPSPVQARGYLRNYAEFLGLDVARLLEELKEANAQKPPDVVIGPADVPVVQEAKISEPEPVPVAAPLEEPAPLIKPKPARRKKTAPQPEGEPAAPPKGRGRKKTDPELGIQIEPPDVSPGQGSKVVEAPVPPESETFQPDAPPPLAHKNGMASFLESARQIRDEVPEDVPHVPAAAPPGDGTEPPAGEPAPGSDVNDSLWQTWLNRLGSTLAARSKRRTLVPNEPVISGLEQNAGLPPGEQEPVLEVPPLQEESTQIFQEIGRELRQRRELLSLHLEEVERNTHVKAHYLDALERGAMDDLPSTVQTRGMLSNYATFLDLDVDAQLLRFADALQARYRERNPQKPARKPGQPILASLPPMRSFIAGDLIFGVGIVVLLVGFAIWGVSRVLTLQDQQDVNPTAPSISDILLASPGPSSFTATPTEEIIEAFPGQPTVTVVIPTLNANVNVQVNLVAVERTFMRVIVDGEIVFEGRVVPGTAYPFQAVDRVEVLVGSGAAIRIVYNSHDLGLLGSFGQVVHNIYRTDEIVTPTGMPTPTATITPTATNTVPASATSQFTATPGTATPASTDTAVP